MLQLRKHLSPGGRNKSVSCPCNVPQVVPLVIAHDDRIESVWSREVTAHHELLPSVDPIFDPRSGPASWLVQTVFSLRDHAFQSLLSGGCNHVGCGGFKKIQELNPRRLKLQLAQQRATFDQWQRCGVTIVVAEQIKHEIANAVCFAPVV